MATWNELLKYDNTTVSVVIPRSEEVLKEYEDFKSKLGHDIESHIVQKYFSEVDCPCYVYTLNDFPYDIERNVLHLVVWVKPGETATMEMIKSELTCRYIDSIVFENDPSVMSVPGLRHFQVFIRKEDTHKLFPR